MAGAENLPRETLERLLDGEVSDHELREEILPDPKDPDRFENVREILQERVDWDEPILVPLNDHLFAVGTDDGRFVKGECGHEFCRINENWKLETQVRVREDEDDLTELYPKDLTPAPDWQYQVREYFCPGCYELLEVEAVPRGYPVLQKFEPDIEVFYEEWLGRPAPDRRGESPDA